MLAGFALAALVASALAEVVPGVAKVDLGTPPLLQALAFRSYATMRAGLQHGVVLGSLLNWEPERLQSNTS